MTRPIKAILVVVAGVAGFWLVHQFVLGPMYFRPRGELNARIASARKELAKFDAADADHRNVKLKLQQIVDRTLGGDLESVDHRLRTRLNRLAEQAQLQAISTGTLGSATPRQSPARSVFRTKELRNEPDFVEVQGWVSGNGPFEQVLRLIDSIEAEPWIKRIDELKLDPTDNGGKFAVQVRLTTVFVPGRLPDPAAKLGPQPARPERYNVFAQANPFRVPPPAPNPPVVAVTAGPAPFAYDQWFLTGIAQSAIGREAWLLNRQTSESRRLLIGDRLHDAVLVSAARDHAEFLIGTQRFAVSVGKNLNDRTSVNQ